jgi:hypothetical protein
MTTLRITHDFRSARHFVDAQKPDIYRMDENGEFTKILDHYEKKVSAAFDEFEREVKEDIKDGISDISIRISVVLGITGALMLGMTYVLLL